MTRRDVIVFWLIALAYTVYAAGVIALGVLLAPGGTVGEWVCGGVGFVLALLPLLLWTLYEAR
jgi:hypothetical protein